MCGSIGDMDSMRLRLNRAATRAPSAPEGAPVAEPPQPRRRHESLRLMWSRIYVCLGSRRRLGPELESGSQHVRVDGSSTQV